MVPDLSEITQSQRKRGKSWKEPQCTDPKSHTKLVDGRETVIAFLKMKLYAPRV